MSLSKTLWFLVGLILSAQSGYAVLQTADPKKDQAAGSSTLVSTAGSAQGDSPVATGVSKSAGKMTLRLKPRHPTPPGTAPKKVAPVAAVEESAPAASGAPAQKTDLFSLGLSRLTHPQAVYPEGVSPVVEKVSGPEVNFKTQYAKVKSVKPTRTSLTLSQSG